MRGVELIYHVYHSFWREDHFAADRFDHGVLSHASAVYPALGVTVALSLFL